MQKTKLVNIIRTFTDEELKRFIVFVNSPFFNTDKNLVNLSKVLKKYHPEFSSGSLYKKKMFKKIFPGKIYNDNVMRNLSSGLLRLTEEFLLYKNIRNESLTSEFHLLKELYERNLHKHFFKKV